MTFHWENKLWHRLGMTLRLCCPSYSLVLETEGNYTEMYIVQDCLIDYSVIFVCSRFYNPQRSSWSGPCWSDRSHPDVHLLIDCSTHVHQSNTLIWWLLFIKETVLYDFVTKMDFVIQYMYALYLWEFFSGDKKTKLNPDHLQRWPSPAPRGWLWPIAVVQYPIRSLLVVQYHNHKSLSVVQYLKSL